MEDGTPVGKIQLLAWCAKVSGKPCTKLEDLRNGTALLGIFLKVFPKLAEKKLRIRWTPRFDHEEALNWDALEQAVLAIRLPPELFDRKGLQACRFRPVYNLLVALFFLEGVSASSDFAADFCSPN